MEEKFNGRHLKRKMVLDDEDEDEDDEEENCRAKKRKMVLINDIEDRHRLHLQPRQFRVLLPNGATVGFSLKRNDPEILFKDFIALIKDEYDVARRVFPKRKGTINWSIEKLYLQDANDNKTKSRINLRHFSPNKTHFLRLHDGSGQSTKTFENMWDLTPDTDFLRELPEEYTFETALADLIDNSLQAVWQNYRKDRKLISVNVLEDKISIFDTGPGMDNSDENSIVKWGKMGASLNRLFKTHAIGCEAPYLVPFFGMFGYGGPIASMHLGSCAIVSSKTKESKKVYELQFSQKVLLCNSGSDTWRTDGSIRDPLDDEIAKSPHGSFTKVEILEPKVKNLDISRLRCKLKDIYFPYIQCDELSKVGRTITPVEFQVNCIDLAEIEGGETAITNLLSCNGPEFTVRLHFSLKKENVTSNGSGSKAHREANARLKCIYYPILKGKENIERILESLNAEDCGFRENFDKFSRVSIRRLGRLLPDERWTMLPFMDLRQRKGEKAQLLKRCCLRVKCFVETDAGFNPTPSKTDLAHHSPFSVALKNFGCRLQDKEKDVDVVIERAGKQLTPMQLDRVYEDWLLQMHDKYDEEIESGEDEPTLVPGPLNKKALGISTDVIRVHKLLKRKGVLWKRAQKIKILKGACAGCHKNNVYATIEYFLIEGFQGDSGGEARIICSPLGVENGSVLSLKDGNSSFDLNNSLSLPVNVIDSGKCVAINETEWNSQLEKQRRKTPSKIDLLNAKQCTKLVIDGALPPNDATVHAGDVSLKNIVAVLRPSSFGSPGASNELDQKGILKIVDLEMSMEIKFRRTKNHQDVKHIYSLRVRPSSHKGFHGLYIFTVENRFTDLFNEAGVYTFVFSAEHSSCPNYKHTILVGPSPKVGKLKLLTDGKNSYYKARVGSCFPNFNIACYDIYYNRMTFTSIPNLNIKLTMNEDFSIDVTKMKPSLSSDKSVLWIKDVMIESDKLDTIRPHYAAILMIYWQDQSVSISVDCLVTPGALYRVKASSQHLADQLIPGSLIEEFVLEMFDEYGNHVAEGLELQFNLDGFSIEGQTGSKYKVDDHGCIDLGGRLKVTAGYGQSVSLSVLNDNGVIFKQEFHTEKRELRISSRVPERCIAGSTLELGFEVVDFKGNVDRTFHDDEKRGQSHTLIIKQESFSQDDPIHYAFRHGRCNIPSFSLPLAEGLLCYKAFHSRYAELHCNFEISLKHALRVESDEIEVFPSDEKVLLLQNSPSVDNGNVGNVLSMVEYEKELESEVSKYAERIGQTEECLKLLESQKTALKGDIYELQASLEPNLKNDLDCLCTKDEMMKLIWERGPSAAALACSLAQDPGMHVMVDVMGVVALLGTVCTIKLSRILAEYLGEDQMLAVVCKSYTAARALEQYDYNGEVDPNLGLHAVATELGKSINGRFNVVCLEDIRPYLGPVEVSDPQRKLVLPNPILPSGKCPPGFIGYAVNMVNLDYPLIDYNTFSGFGLRETLFYRLFYKLQVYETREHMEIARRCIEHGAVSLDGGIMRENGIISLGHRNPAIYFPVEKPMSPKSKEIYEEYKKKKLGLGIIQTHIDRKTEKHKRSVKKFNKEKDRLHKYFDSIGDAIKDHHTEYAPNTPIPK